MADFENPLSRNEAILQNILGANNELAEPQSRIETLLTLILENGGGSGAGGVFSVPVTFDDETSTETCTKTWKEIYDAMASGKICILYSPIESGCYMRIAFAVNSEASFEVSTFDGVNAALFIADSENGYPYFVDD